MNSIIKKKGDHLIETEVDSLRNVFQWKYWRAQYVYRYYLIHTCHFLMVVTDSQKPEWSEREVLFRNILHW